MPLPDEIATAGNNFAPGFDVTDDLGDSDYWTLWEGEFDAKSGVTGLWLPTENWMVVAKRSVTHHNQAYRSVYRDHGHISPVLPWAANVAGDAWHVDVPSTAGGMTQVLSRLEGGEGVDSWQHGHQISPSDVWPILYTCRLLDLPPDSTVSVRYTTPRIQSADPNYFESETFLLEAAYTEMKFAPGGLPGPQLDRQQYL